MNITPIIWWAIFLVPGVLGPSFGLWDFQAFLHEYFPKFVALPLSLVFSGKCLFPVLIPVLASAMFGKQQPKADGFFKQRPGLVALSFAATGVIWFVMAVMINGQVADVDVSLLPSINFDSNTSQWPSWWQWLVSVCILLIAVAFNSRVWESTFFDDKRNVVVGQESLPPPPRPHWFSCVSLWGFACSMAIVSLVGMNIFLFLITTLFFFLGGCMLVPLREKWVVAVFKKPREMQSAWWWLFPTFYRDPPSEDGTRYGEKNLCFTNGFNFTLLPLWLPVYNLIMIRFESIEREYKTPPLPTKRVTESHGLSSANQMTGGFAEETLPGATLQSDFRLTMMTGSRSQVWLGLSNEDQAKSPDVCLVATVGFLSRQYRRRTVKEIFDTENTFTAPTKNPYLDGDFEPWKEPWKELDELMQTRVGYGLQSLQFLDHNLDVRLETASNELAALQNLQQIREAEGSADGRRRIVEIEKFASTFFNIPKGEPIPSEVMLQAIRLMNEQDAIRNSRYIFPPGENTRKVNIAIGSDYTNPR